MKPKPWKKIVALCLLFILASLLVSAPLNAVDAGAGKVLAFDPGESQIKVPKEMSRGLLGEMGWDGSGSGFPGEKLALVDTGVDPSIVSSLVNFIDLTGEGSVRTSEPISVSRSNLLTYQGKTYDVRGVATKSGRLRVGYFVPDKSLPQGALCGEVFQGIRDIPVVVADSYLPNQYDTVYIDTNLNGSFSDEKGLEVYRNSKSYVLLSRTNSRLPFSIVVCDIFDNGENIVLGFDGHGHGTSVASIISGDGNDLLGVAPSAKISAIKAVDSTGRSSWRLLAQAVMRALEDEAKIIVLALAPDRVQENDPAMAEAIRAAEKRGVVLVMAAGNLGPGLSTLPQYAQAENVITTGGYVPLGVADYLSMNGGGGWYPWSSSGPTKDGATVTVLAPALAPALVPAWKAQSGTSFLFEGTSASAAFGGGAAALVLGQADSNGISLKPDMVRKALEEGARSLGGVEAVFQGKGLLDIGKSVGIARKLKDDPKVRTVFKWQGTYQSKGFFDRNRFLGHLPFTVDNLSPYSLRLDVKTPNWLKIPTKSLGLPAVEYRGASLSTDTSLEYGLHSGWILGDDPSLFGTELSALFTTIRPKDLSQLGHLGIQKILPSGDVHREYLQVPEGLESLSVSAKVVDSPSGKPRGRIQVFVYDQEGVLRYQSGWIGKDAQSKAISTGIRFPGSGVWEFCVVSDPAPPIDGISGDSVFDLGVYASGITPKSTANEVVLQGEFGAGRLDMINTGESFQCETIPVIPGENGWVRQERVFIGPDSAVAKTMPDVPEGARFLYMRADNPLNLSADLDIYLYHFDKKEGRWLEVASAKAKGPGGEEIALSSPEPGQYIAYVEASGLIGGETEFYWTAVQASEPPAVEGVNTPIGQKVFEWKSKSERTLPVRIPKSSLQRCLEDSAAKRWDGSGTAYLTIWDDKTGLLRDLVPLGVYDTSDSPFVYLGRGAQGQKGTMATIKAWHPLYWKPLDAAVRLGDVWYQLENGEATVLLPGLRINGLNVEARYPGMAPSRKRIVE